MRFRTKTRPRGLLKSSDQRRLTLLTLAVAVVLVGFSVARQPAFWAELFPSESGGGPASGQAEDERAVFESDEMLSAERRATRLQHDEFLVAGAGDGGQLRTTFKPPAELNSGMSSEADGSVRVKRELLDDVSDDVIGVHSAESEAYFSALKLAQKFEQRPNLTAPKAAFALFMADPEAARGLPWHVRGKLRRLTAVRRGTTMHGIGTMYEGWLTTADSGDQLIHVVATSISPKLARLLSDRNSDPTIDFGKEQPPYVEPPEVEFIGYFFKREAYASRSDDGVSLAPMFVAGSVRLVPVPVTTVTRADKLYPYLSGLAIAICVGMGVMAYSFLLSDREYSRTRAHQLTKLPARASFEDVTAVSPAESLRELQQDQTADQL